jgi:hypothetical protein
MSSSLQAAPRCAHCSATSATTGKALDHCNGCNVTYYCSRDCQVKDWRFRHKYTCGNGGSPNARQTPTSSAVVAEPLSAAQEGELADLHKDMEEAGFRDPVTKKNILPYSEYFFQMHEMAAARKLAGDSASASTIPPPLTDTPAPALAPPQSIITGSLNEAFAKSMSDFEKKAVSMKGPISPSPASTTGSDFTQSGAMPQRLLTAWERIRAATKDIKEGKPKSADPIRPTEPRQAPKIPVALQLHEKVQNSHVAPLAVMETATALGGRPSQETENDEDEHPAVAETVVEPIPVTPSPKFNHQNEGLSGISETIDNEEPTQNLSAAPAPAHAQESCIDHKCYMAAARHAPYKPALPVLIPGQDECWNYFQQLREIELYHFLIDMFRCRVINGIVYGKVNSLSYHRAEDPIVAFECFLNQMEDHGEMLPTWWTRTKRNICKMVTQTPNYWTCLHTAVEEKDIVQHYAGNAEILGSFRQLNSILDREFAGSEEGSVDEKED